MHHRTFLVLALLLAAPLAGCVGGGKGDGDAAVGPTDTETTSVGPDGTAYNATANATYLKNADYRDTHLHDYWGDGTQLDLMNEEVETRTFCCRRSLEALADADSGFGGQVFSLPNNTFVPEGTGRLLVEIDATAAGKAGNTLQFEFSPRGWGGDWIALTAGQLTASWEIELTPDQADLPHARSTQWMFIVQAGGGTVLDGPVHVSITAFKVHDVLAWPAHPDFWGGGSINRLDLMNETVSFSRASPTLTDRLGIQEHDPILLPQGKIVPPETGYLVVRLSYTINDGVDRTVVTDVQTDFKPGSSGFRSMPGFCYEVDRGEDWHLYVLPLDETNWDSPYAAQSSWQFHLRLENGVHVDDLRAGFLGWAVQYGSGSVTFDVKAFHEAPQWMDEDMTSGRCGFDRDQ